MQIYSDAGYGVAGAYCGKKAGLAALCAWGVIFLETLYLISLSGITPGIMAVFILLCLAGAGLAGAMIYFSRSTTASPGAALMGFGIPLLLLPIIQLLVLSADALQLLPYILTLAAAVVMLGGVHGSIDNHEHPVPRKVGGIAAIVLLCFQVYFLIVLIGIISDIQKLGGFEIIALNPILQMPLIIGFFFMGGSIFTGILSLLNMLKQPGDDSMAKMAVTVANLVGYITPALILLMLIWILGSAGAPGQVWLVFLPFAAALMTAVFAPLWPVALGISLRLTASLEEVQARPRTTGEARAAQAPYDPRTSPESYRREGQPEGTAPHEKPSRPAPADYNLRALDNQLQYGIITQEEYEKRKKQLEGG